LVASSPTSEHFYFGLLGILHPAVTILAFFEHDYIELIDVDRRIGEQANEFCRQYSLYPNDAIHLACALRGGVMSYWHGTIAS
jgi:predicted nucleic acid-binding protein